MKNASMNGTIVNSASMNNVGTSTETIDNNKSGGDGR